MADLKCLVVEDEPGIGWAIRSLLERAAATVTVAVSGASAIEALAQQRFAAIFLDVKLPDADGDYHGDVKCMVCGSMLQVAIENEHVKSVKLMAAAQSHHRRGNGVHRKEAQ